MRNELMHSGVKSMRKEYNKKCGLATKSRLREHGYV